MITSTRRSLALMLVILLLGSFILPAGAFAESGSEPASNTSEAAAPTESVPSEAVQNQETTSDDPVESEAAAQLPSGTDGAENTAPGAGSISSGSDTASLSSSGSSGSGGSISSADGTAPADTDAAATIEFFLSSAGDDASGDGSLEAPFASIDRAMEAAGDADSVILILLTDLSVSETQQFSGKTVLLTSNDDPCTISPAEDFSDPGEPLILVGNPDPNAEPLDTELQLEFVTLSDRITEDSALTAPIIEVCAGGILTAGEEASVLTDGTHAAVHGNTDSEIHVLEGGHITGDPAIAADENCLVEVDENADVPGYVQPEEETEGDLSEASTPADPAEGSIDPVDGGVDNQPQPGNTDEQVNAANTTPADTPDNPSDSGNSENGSGNNESIGTEGSDEVGTETNDSTGNGDGTDGSSTPDGLNQQQTASGVLTDSVGLLAASGDNALLAAPPLGAANDSTGFSLSAPEFISEDDPHDTQIKCNGTDIQGFPLKYLVSFKIQERLISTIKSLVLVTPLTSAEINIDLALNTDPLLFPAMTNDSSMVVVSPKFSFFNIMNAVSNESTVSITLGLGNDWQSNIDDLDSSLSFEILTVLPTASHAPNIGKTLTSTATLTSMTFTTTNGEFHPDANYLSGMTDIAETKITATRNATLIYDMNGGTGGPETPQSFPEGTINLDTTNTPTHADVDGYPVIFLGWTAEPTSVIYASGDTAPTLVTSVELIADESRTVYAAYSYNKNWEEESKIGTETPDVYETVVTLTYDMNDGSNNYFYRESKALRLPLTTEDRNFKITNQEPTRDNYTFLGWSDSSTGSATYRAENKATGNQQDRIELTEDKTIYAVWQPNPVYTLSFNGKGGSNVPSSVSAQSDNIGGTFQASVTIPTTVPTRDKHNFLGWAETLTATEPVYDPGETILIDRNTTLYAVWERNALYTLYFNGTGASDAPAAQTAEAVDGVASMTIPNQTPTRSRYSFVGWATTRYGSASFFPGEDVRLTGGDVTLYAVWQRNGTSTTADGTAPKTGDESNVALYAALAAGSAAALGAVFFVLRRKRS